GAHRHLLYHLGEDPGETKNLADDKPELVKELDDLIEDFLTRTKAVVPVPNPDFDPAQYRPELEGKPTLNKKPKAPANNAAVPLGWRAANCTGNIKEGIMHLTEVGDTSFLGLTAGKLSGASTVKFRIKAKAGVSHLDWLPDGPQGKAQSVEYTAKGGDWEEITVNVPATGPLGVVRLYFPKETTSAQVDWVALQSKQQKARFDF
ncbi:MAG: hypothetical protein ACKO2G_02965, partial [Verrucomicrobiales bacterium]